MGGFANSPVDLVLRQPPHLEGEAHVPVRVHVRVERVVLEHHGDVPFLRRKIVHDLPVDLHVPGRDRLQARDHAQRGRLSAAGRSDEHDELAGPDLEVEAGDGFGSVGIDLRQTLEDDLRHANLLRNLVHDMV